MDPSNIQEVFEAQRQNRWHIAQSTAEQRIAKLKRLKAALLSRRHEIVAAMKNDFGKCQAEVAISEIAPVTEEIAFVCARLKRWMKPRRVAAHLFTLGSRSEVRYEAKGQVLILAPWNYPVHLFLLPLVGAIAAGNVVMITEGARKGQKFEYVGPNTIHGSGVTGRVDLSRMDYANSTLWREVGRTRNAASVTARTGCRIPAARLSPPI